MRVSETFLIAMTGSRLSWQTLGAQVLQASCGGLELLYVSPWHTAESKRAARGGVPVLFPQFADRGPLKKHGWARDVDWALREEHHEGGTHVVAWDARLDDPTPPLWPHQAVLRLSVSASAGGLDIQLHIHNAGQSAFEWTGGLHPYWATHNVLECQLMGLQGVGVQDRYDATRACEAHTEVVWSGEAFESLYDSPDPVWLRSPSHTIKLSMTGFDQWMVWNPGADEAKRMIDLPDDGWQRFVCIEPVRVNRPCCLQPGERFTGTLRAEWCPNDAGAAT